MNDNLSFSPASVPYVWDAVEVHPVRYVSDGEDTLCEQVESDADADFWSVYLHTSGKGVMCVADLPTKESAVALGELITKASNALSIHLDAKLYVYG